jgi:hypothetical protein
VLNRNTGTRMSTILSSEQFYDDSPLDTVERVAGAANLPFERFNDEELLAAHYTGPWCVYEMWFAYSSDVDALEFRCGFDMKVPTERLDDVCNLLALINEKMWLGHFDLREDERRPTWRHTFIFRGAPRPAEAQIEDMLGIALQECNRFYPAFQHVIWAGKSPHEALELALFETAGEA